MPPDRTSRCCCALPSAYADHHAGGARIVAAAAALVLGLALWLTSSRAAIVGVLVVGGLSAIVTFVRSGAWGGRLPGRAAAPAATIVPIAPGSGSRHRGALFGIAGLTVATLVVLLFLPNRLIGGNAAAAAEIRRDMATVSWRLLARNPAFGVGIGQYLRALRRRDAAPAGRAHLHPAERAQQLPADPGGAGGGRLRLLCRAVMDVGPGSGCQPRSGSDTLPDRRPRRGARHVPDLGAVRPSTARAGLRVCVLDDRRSRRRLRARRCGPCPTAHSRRWPQRPF